jgi:hypothetical protein
MSHHQSFFLWLENNWARSALPVAVVVALLLPLSFGGVESGTFVAMLFVPVLLIHLYASHAEDGTRRFLNRFFDVGSEPVTRRVMLVSAAVGGWALALLGPFLTAFLGPTLLAIPAVIAGVELLLRLVGSVLSGKASPGLGTALVLLLPYAVLAVGAVETIGNGEGLYLVGLLVALVPRVAVAAVVLSRRSRLVAQPA